MSDSPNVQGFTTLSPAPTGLNPSAAVSLNSLVQQQQLYQPGGIRTAPPSAAGSIGSSTVTSLDATNEARRVITRLLDPDGQGRLSFMRIGRELRELQEDVYVHLRSQPKSRTVS